MKTRAQWEKILAEVPEEHADLLLSAAAKVRQSLYGGGPARKLLPCPKCGEPFSAREMRKHTPRCGAHLVQCRFGCGFTGNPMGAGQHEALCAMNPKRKQGKVTMTDPEDIKKEMVKNVESVMRAIESRHKSKKAVQ